MGCLSKTQILFFVASLITVGCSTTSTRSPLSFENVQGLLVPLRADRDPRAVESFLDYYLNEKNDPQTRHWATYLRALNWSEKNPTKSCAAFSELAKESAFRLQFLSQIRYWERCLAPAEGAEKFLSSLNQPGFGNGWLKAYRLDLGLNLAKNLPPSEIQLKLTVAKAKASDSPAEKANFYRQALEISKSLNKADEALEYEALLYQWAPRLKPNLSPNDYLSAAEDFKKNRDFDKSVEIYKSASLAFAGQPDQLLNSLHGIRSTLKLAQRNSEALASAEKLYEVTRRLFQGYDSKAALSGSPRPKRLKSIPIYSKRLLDNGLLTARAAWTEGKIARAREILGQLEKDLKGQQPLEDIYWIQSRMEEEAGRTEAALLLSEQALKVSREGTPLWEKLMWGKAWNLKKIKKFEQARSLFEALKNKSGTPFSRSKYSFWLGKTLKELNQTERAQVEWNEIIQLDPIGYYATLSYRELKKGIPPIPNDPNGFKKFLGVEKGASPSSTIPGRVDKELLDWLMWVGETEIARFYLNSLMAAPNSDPEAIEFIFRSYERLGDYQNLFQRLSWLGLDGARVAVQVDPNFVFPRPYLNLVQKASSRFAVSPELIYAIMRQESSFNPNARSPADAFGLLQLLPEVANRTARRYKLSSVQPEDLFVPQNIIPIGTAHLRDLSLRYRGQLILVAASYNASEEAVRGWLKTRLNGDVLEFIEDIPYEETKTYVKLVLRNLIFYMRLSSEQPELPFPEFCLEGLQDFKG